MDDLTVVTFKWGTKFSAQDVLALRHGIAGNLSIPHRFVCITDDPSGLGDIETLPLWDDYRDFKDGCYCRLKLFGEDILGTERFFWMDLDAVVVGDMTPIVEDLMKYDVGLVTGLHYLPIINGSFVWHKFGTRRWVWDEFGVRVADRFANISGTYWGTDQSWLHLCLGKDIGTRVLSPRDGLHGFRKSAGWSDIERPDGAKVVFFPGGKYSHADVERGHWLTRYLA